MIPDITGQLIERNKIFHNCHQGNRCFVIGNGSSLNTQDLSPLADELTLVMNSFWKHPIVTQWQPSYYCLADSAYFDGQEPFLAVGMSMTIEQFFTELRSRIHSIFFFPLEGAKISIETSFLPLERTYFIPFQGILSQHGLSSLPDITKTIPMVQSVSQLAIMIAMYMGCSPIYLLGLDHDWFASWGLSRNFYGTYPTKPDTDDPTVQNKRSYKCELEAQLRLWQGYECLLNVAQANHIQILNVTNGGFLDVFERADYESVVKNSPSRKSSFQKGVVEENKVHLVEEQVQKNSSPYPSTIPTEQILQQRAVHCCEQANQFMSQGDFSSALQLLDEAMYIYPQIQNLQYARSFCLWKLGRLNEAKVAINAEVRTYPKNQPAIEFQSQLQGK